MSIICLIQSFEAELPTEFGNNPKPFLYSHPQKNEFGNNPKPILWSQSQNTKFRYNPKLFSMVSLNTEFPFYGKSVSKY